MTEQYEKLMNPKTTNEFILKNGHKQEKLKGGGHRK